MRNIIATYNVKGREGMARWDIDRLEANRLQRLSAVRSVMSRPPRPQVQAQHSSRHASAASRKPVRARSASAQRSSGTGLPTSGESDPATHAKSARRDGSGHLDPLFMLSPGSRERDAQQYLNCDAEAAALREEMQDWYFAPSTARYNERPMSGDACDFEASKPSSASDARRRSPYALDQRHQSQPAGRPQSMPPSVAGQSSQQPRLSSGTSQQRLSNSRPVSRSRERLQAACEFDGQPDVDILVKAAAAMPKHIELPVSSVPNSPQCVPTQRSAGDLQRNARDAQRNARDTKTKSPDLKSADAINDWLLQAQQRVDSIFSNGAPEESQNQTKEAVVRPSSASRQRGDDRRPLSSRGAGMAAAASPSAQRQPANLQTVEAKQPPMHTSSPASASNSVPGAVGTNEAAVSPVPDQPASPQPVKINPASEYTSFAQSSASSSSSPPPPLESKQDAIPASSAKASAELLDASMSKAPPSESDHFSQDAFEETDADADEAGGSFDASAVSAAIVSDRGSEASLSIDAADPATSAPQVAIGGRSDSGLSASMGRKVEGLGATNASISYDEDFEADADEEDTLGASIGGA